MKAHVARTGVGRICCTAVAAIGLIAMLGAGPAATKKSAAKPVQAPAAEQPGPRGVANTADLSLTTSTSCVSGSQLIVDVNLSNLVHSTSGATVVGGQFFLAFNTTYLSLAPDTPVGTNPVGVAPWTRRVSFTTPAAGHINLAVGIPSGGTGGTSGPMARITFNIVAEQCTPTADLVSFRASGPNGALNLLTDNNGDEVTVNDPPSDLGAITIDQTDPVADQAPGDGDDTLECSDAAGIAAAVAFAPTFTDNCTASVSAVLASDNTTPDGSCPNAYVRVRTWTASDGCGNTSAVYTQTITVVDTTDPVADQAPGDGDDTLECSDAAGIAAAVAFAPTFTDNCTASVSAVLASDNTTPDGSCPNAYVRVRTWTASDGCGNTSAVYTQTITVVDTTDPVADQAPGDGDDTLECSDAAGIAAAVAFAPTFTDNCTASVSAVLASDNTTPDGSCPNAYVRVRTWTAGDGCGNTSAVYTQTITVVDTTDPVADQAPGAGDDTLECSDAAGIAAAVAFAPTFTDNCTASVSAVLASDNTTPDGSCPNAYVRVRTWTAGDGCGNTSAVYTQTITVVDTTDPVADQAPGDGDDTLECSDAAGIAAAVAFAPTFTDNCTASVSAVLASDNTTPDGSCPNAYVRVRTWTAGDGCGNTSAVYTQTITVVDTTDPVADQAPGAGDDTLECSDAAGIAAAVAFAPTFTDNCTASVSAVLASDNTTPDGSCPNAYVRVRTWTAGDGCGNTSAVYTQTITVVDTTDPVADQAPGAGDDTLECSDAAGIAAAVAFAPTFTDNCTASVSAVLASDNTTPDGSCPNAYVRVRTWTAGDGCGNTSAVYTQTITVVDTTDPVIAECPMSNITVHSVAGSCTSAQVFYSASATDNCDAAVTPVFSPPSGSTFGPGTHTVTVTATDSCGNESSCQFTVTNDGMNELVVDVELGGGVMSGGSYTRCVTFELWNGMTLANTATSEISFAGGNAAPVTLLVPCNAGPYTCITARDRKHTLRETIGSVPTNLSGQYTADFIGGSKLVGGNLNDDRFIDILDFGIFTTQDLTAPGPNTLCGYVRRHADVDGDGVVDSVDFNFIATNFLTVRDLNCNGNALMAGGPVTRISVADLHQQGMSDLVPADLNADGWLDQADVSAYMNGVRPGHNDGPTPESRPTSGRPTGLRPAGPISPLD